MTQLVEARLRERRTGELEPGELQEVAAPYESAGFALRFDRASVTPDGTLKLQAHAYEAGERVAWFDRVLGLERAWHRASLTFEEHRLRGVARRLFAATLALYDELDIERVDLVASGDGRYVWARCGFEFVDDKVHRLAAERGVDLGAAVHPWEVAALPAGRALLLAPALDAWEGTFDVRRESASRRQFEAYVAAAARR